MMLDSTLGKVLASKQVEPSIPEKSNTSEKGESPGHQSTSEAEVRLVVRLTVEEQIVYKGKVEKVHQLENEELSRIVSRVAWDDSKCKANETNDSGHAHFESQHVTDAINDCVDRVELEMNLLDEQSACPEYAVPTDISAELEIEMVDLAAKEGHNEKSVATTTELIGESVNFESALQHSIPEVASERIESDSTERASSKPDLNVHEATVKSTETSSQHKRKPSEETAPSSKKMRRASAKEQQNSRTPAVKNADVAIKHDVDRARLSSDGPILVQQPIRHNKIFAKWSDNHFYPGTIIKPTKDRKFVVNFFDGAQRNVAETDLIPLCNIHGKQVRVTIAKDYCVNAIVHEQRGTTAENIMFDVEYQQDGTVRKCVPLDDIFLTGEQGTPLINQPDKNSGASNFADVDLDNIIYEKRSRRLQDMDDYELTENTSNNSTTSKRKRSKYNMRNVTPRSNRNSRDTLENSNKKTTKLSTRDDANQDSVSACSPEASLKASPNCPNSNPPSESSSSTGSSIIQNGVSEMGQEFYFTSSSPHRTKTSLLL